jgi:hypothetical protein
MNVSKNNVRALIESLTAERDRIERAIDGLRSLVDETTATADKETNGGHAELPTNGNGVAAHANGHANGHRRVERPVLKGALANVVKTLDALTEPMRPMDIHQAMGRKAPAKTEMYRLLNKAAELGVAKRQERDGAIRFVRVLQ